MATSLSHSAVVGTNNASTTLTDVELLRQVGIRGMQRRAGFVPPVSDGELPEADINHDDEKICSQASVVQFFELSNHLRIPLHSIWLERFIESGQKFPNEFLPSILKRLNNSYRSFSDYSKFVSIMSQRVEWLIQYPDYESYKWVFKKTPKLERDSKFALKENFISRFEALRRENPYKAADWLSDNWHQFKTDWWTEYLEVLHISLNPYDETFLEDALIHSEEAEIADKVAYLLSLLEADSIQKVISDIIDMTRMEMTQHGLVLDFRWTRVFEKHPSFAWQSTLMKPIATKYAWSGTALQLIQTVPLEYWCQHYGVSPQELVAAIYNGFHGKEFSEAWWFRLKHEKREDFLRALLNNKVTGFGFRQWDYKKKLIEGLPFELFQIVVDEWLHNA